MSGRPVAGQSRPRSRCRFPISGARCGDSRRPGWRNHDPWPTRPDGWRAPAGGRLGCRRHETHELGEGIGTPARRVEGNLHQGSIAGSHCTHRHVRQIFVPGDGRYLVQPGVPPFGSRGERQPSAGRQPGHAARPHLHVAGVPDVVRFPIRCRLVQGTERKAPGAGNPARANRTRRGPRYWGARSRRMPAIPGWAREINVSTRTDIRRVPVTQ